MFGMSNKIRVLVSAMILAESQPNTQLVVHWDGDNHCPANFQSLFKNNFPTSCQYGELPPACKEPCSIHACDRSPFADVDKECSGQQGSRYASLEYGDGVSGCPNKPNPQHVVGISIGGDNQDALRANCEGQHKCFNAEYGGPQCYEPPKGLHLNTCCAFKSQKDMPDAAFEMKLLEKFSELQPVDFVAQKTNEMLANFQQYPLIIGVHVRFGDQLDVMYQENRFTNSVENFLKKVEDLKSKRPANTLVFLATDTQEVQNIFKKKYDHNVMWQNDITEAKVARNNTMDSQIALVDLIMLSHCHFVVGTGMSSFSVLAGTMAKQRQRLQRMARQNEIPGSHLHAAVPQEQQQVTALDSLEWEETDYLVDVAHPQVLHD